MNNRGQLTKTVLAMHSSRTGKSQYSETEAAEELGVSVEQLRSMIRSHVVDRDEDLNNVPVTTFQPSDLLVLRLLGRVVPEPRE
jgi:hypothetical protein